MKGFWRRVKERLCYETGWQDVQTGDIIQHNLNMPFEYLNWHTTNRAVAVFEVVGSNDSVQVVIRPDIPLAYTNITVTEK